MTDRIHKLVKVGEDRINDQNRTERINELIIVGQTEHGYVGIKS